MSTPIFPNAPGLNVFVPVPMQGKLTNAPNNIINARVSKNQAYPLIPGAAVKADTAAAYNVIEVLAANPDDPIIGFIPYEEVKNSYIAYDTVPVAREMSIMWMVAESAFNAGDTLEYDNTTDPTKVQVKKWAGSNTPIGRAETGAAAPGAYVRVYIMPLNVAPHSVSS